MRTRNFLLVALIATGFFSACNNDTAEPLKSGQEISFRLQGGMPEVTTRALATTLENLDAFVVFGTDNVSAATSGLLFDGVTVSRKLGNLADPTVFTYSPAVYYNENASQAGFFAFSPISAIELSNIDVTNFMTGASFDYTVPVPGVNGDGNVAQVDLLVAGAALAGTPLPTTVNLTFEHALSRIFITASNATPDPVIITGLRLLNLVTTGTLNVDPSAAWDWTSSSILGNYPFILAESGVVVPGTTLPPPPDKLYVTSMEQGMMVLPQETVNKSNDYSLGDFALEINYDFANLKNQTKYVYLVDGYKFEKSMQYRINITFTGTAIDFHVDVDPFDPITEVTYP